jgi:hypothetical protein
MGKENKNHQLRLRRHESNLGRPFEPKLNSGAAIRGQTIVTVCASKNAKQSPKDETNIYNYVAHTGRTSSISPFWLKIVRKPIVKRSQLDIVEQAQIRMQRA